MFALEIIQQMNNAVERVKYRQLAIALNGVLKTVASPVRGPLTWNPKTFAVTDKKGNVRALIGPKMMRAIKRMQKEKV